MQSGAPLSSEDGQTIKPKETMTFREILQALWRRRRLLEIAAVVAVVLGLAIVVMQGTSYRAETEVLLNQQSVVAPGGDGLLTQQKLNLQVLTYAQLVRSSGFAKEHLDDRNIGFKSVKVDSKAVPNTPIVEITVTASSPERAALAARALADGLRDEIRNSQPDLPEELATTTRIIQEPSAKLVSADPIFAVLVALIAGLALAATAALIIESE